MKRTCEQCGISFDAVSSRARFCGSTCRGRAHRQKPSAVVRTISAVEPVGSSLADETIRELEGVGRLSTAAGRLCVILAQRIDAVPESSPGLSSLSKEWASRMADVMDTAAPALSPFDELKEMRERRRSS